MPSAPARIGVFPAHELEDRRNLLAALELAFPVRFEGRGRAELRDLDGTLDLGDGTQAAASAAAGIDSLWLLRSEAEEDGAALTQELSEAEVLDRRLRGAHLPDHRLGEALGAGGLETGAGTTVLASHRDEATWIRESHTRTALLSPRELEPEEALRERLCDGRSAALLPLVHFLRELTTELRWQPPTARACLLFDDPNLHWPSYGFVKLGALAQSARDRGYHAALATVPLDGWFGHPKAVRALRESQGALSLVVHGNDHFGGELGRLETEAEALALAAQARRRVEAFERRSGVTVEPVMVPPHEECAEAVPSSLRRCGFEAVTMTRPFPWLAPSPRSWLARPDSAGPLVGWGATDIAGGLPVLLRHPFVGRSPAELVLRAFLNQPLILYGHQADLQEGLGVLESAVADVNRIGLTRWCPLGEIVASRYESHRQDSMLAVRPLTAKVRVEIPAGIERLRVEPGPGLDAGQLLVDGQKQPLGEPLSVTQGNWIELRLLAGDELDIATVPPPRRQPLALPRRVLSESRDRLAPLLARGR